MSILKHIFGMLLGLLGLLCILFALYVAFVMDNPWMGAASGIGGIIIIMLAKRLNRRPARE